MRGKSLIFLGTHEGQVADAMIEAWQGYASCPALSVYPSESRHGHLLT